MQLNLVLTGAITRFSKGDVEWEQFIRDHVDVLKESAKALYPTLEDKQTYQYRLDDWLLKEMNYPKDYIWIVELVNQFENHMSFSDIDVVLVPDASLIKTLRSTYQSNRNKAARLGN